jgi:hypothetical protein
MRTTKWIPRGTDTAARITWSLCERCGALVPQFTAPLQNSVECLAPPGAAPLGPGCCRAVEQRFRGS